MAKNDESLKDEIKGETWASVGVSKIRMAYIKRDQSLQPPISWNLYFAF